VSLGLSVVAHAAVSSIQPASGETTPGGSVSATVTVDSGILVTCLTATSDDPLNITVAFDGTPTSCGTGTWLADMEVQVSSLAAPGLYTITVQEIDWLGTLLQSHPWPLTVNPPATTTTLFPDPTITILPTTTTTTTLPATTTTPVNTTTTSAASNAQPSDDRESGSAIEPTTTSGPAESTSSSLSDDDGEAAGQISRVGEEKPFSEIAVSSGLIEIADRALPPVFAQAVISPLVILEVLLRALARTSGGLILPLALTVALGFGLARRLRRDAEEIPDLEDWVQIPVENQGEDH
jgi:hypothetical protein